VDPDAALEQVHAAKAAAWADTLAVEVEALGAKAPSDIRRRIAATQDAAAKHGRSMLGAIRDCGIALLALKNKLEAKGEPYYDDDRKHVVGTTITRGTAHRYTTVAEKWPLIEEAMEHGTVASLRAAMAIVESARRPPRLPAPEFEQKQTRPDPAAFRPTPQPSKVEVKAARATRTGKRLRALETELHGIMTEDPAAARELLLGLMDSIRQMLSRLPPA
jgi:hypothetical protein